MTPIVAKMRAKADVKLMRALCKRTDKPDHIADNDGGKVETRLSLFAALFRANIMIEPIEERDEDAGNHDVAEAFKKAA